MINVFETSIGDAISSDERSISTLTLNPFFRIHLGPPITCDLLLDGKSLVFHDPRYIELLSQLENIKIVEEITRKVKAVFCVGCQDADKIINELVHNRILVTNINDYNLEGIQHWIKRGWLDALVLHLRSRNIDCLDDEAADSHAHNDSVMEELIASEGMPDVWKIYQNKARYPLGKGEPLPENQTLEEVLLRRRSFEPWKQKTLRLAQLSTILSYANKETLRLRIEIENEVARRPSVLLNSSFTALETYFFAFAVEGLPNGIYHYDMRSHAVSLLREGVFREEVARMCIGQRRPSTARCVFVVSAVFKRYMYRYRHPRAYRNLLINVSEFAHKYILIATAFGLSTFLTPALEDEYADTLLGVNGYEEAPLYVVAVG